MSNNNEIKYINKKAVAILRVSRDKHRDGFSHDAQLKYAQEYCANDCNDHKLELVKIFTLRKKSKKSDRGQYRAAMDFISKNKIGNVVFFKTNSESRNATDLEANEQAVKQGKFILHFSYSRKCLHKKSPESDFLARTFSSLMASSFARVLASRIKDGLKAKAETGWYPGSKPPLGYMRQSVIVEAGQSKTRGAIVVPNPETIKLVQREFELRAQGLSLESIKKKITVEGLVMGRKALEYKLGALSKRLKNPFYRGQFMWNGILYKGNHELIIPIHHLEVGKMNGTDSVSDAQPECLEPERIGTRMPINPVNSKKVG
jgi:site-specific DNA recombinase